jgi:AcrR family transcriptional regulator
MTHNTMARAPLTRERVLQTAVDLADRDGLDAVTMRRLGGELGFEAMSLYKHVANKEAVLDGMVEVVIAEIDLPATAADWKEAMRRRAVSARDVLRRHSWAIGLLESRRLTSPTTMRYQDAILGALRSAGFSIEAAAHAFWMLDAYVYGQVVQEANLSGSAPEPTTESAGSDLERIARSEYPNLAAVAEHALGSPFSFDGEFEFGLELILDALAGVRGPGGGQPRR